MVWSKDLVYITRGNYMALFTTPCNQNECLYQLTAYCMQNYRNTTPNSPTCENLIKAKDKVND